MKLRENGKTKTLSEVEMNRNILILILWLCLGISLLPALAFDPDIFYSKTVMTCFRMDSIGRFDGRIDFTVQDGIVQTNMSSFNALCEKYRVSDLKQAHPFVKKPEWNEDGRYLQCVYRVYIADDRDMDRAIIDFTKDPNILYAEFESINRAYFVPNDPLLPQQYALVNTECFDAWDYTTGDESILIGITDSGVKWNHPDLMANIWINPDEYTNQDNTTMTIDWVNGTYSGGDGLDGNDYNNKVDDLMGWDFFNTDNNPMQDFAANDHGTHVSGCAGAVYNNGIGVSGTCPNLSIICCKGAPNVSPSTGISYGYDQIKYAAECGAVAINASWGGQASSLSYPNQIVNYATNLGSLVISAAGNDNVEHGTSYMDAPSDCTNALCVAATTANDIKAEFSDYGATIDICAPGVGIMSTIITDNGYAAYDGTSMASPIVTGIAALCKTVNPALTPLELRQRLMDTADWIYDLNPDYANPPKLGMGRVNAFSAAMYDKIPKLTIEDKATIELQGDGDGVCNPGELVRLNLLINNYMDIYTGLSWMTATNVQATLRCHYPGVVIEDSTAAYGTLGSGASNWNTNDPFTFRTVSTLPSEPIPFQLLLTANPTAQYPYTALREFTVDLSLVMPNWPIVLNGASQSSAALVNLDSNADIEVVFGDPSGRIHALKPSNTELTGFPYQAAASIVGALAVADLDANDGPEIAACVSNNHIIALNKQGGLLWDVAAGGTLRANPVIANLNMSGPAEVIAVTQSGSVVALTSTGTAYPNFPVALGTSVLASPAVADLNNDGQLEIIVVALNGTVYAVNSATGQVLTGFPYAMGSSSQNPPCIANIDADANPEILVTTSNSGMLYAINHDGSLLFSKTIGSSIKTGPVVADVDNNGSKEIIVITYAGDIYITNSSGVNLTGTPIVTGRNVECTPIVATIDVDGLASIIFGDTNGKLHAYRKNGTESPNFPITIGGNLKITPAIADIDHNQHPNIVLPNDASYYVIDLKRWITAYQYPCFMGNYARSGNSYQATPNPEDAVPAPETALVANFPNPFNPSTTIRFSLKDPAPVTLEIYNLKGEKVRTLVNETKKSGHYQIEWNGTDDRQHKVSSGIYLYKMTAGRFSASRKMMLMK